MRTLDHEIAHHKQHIEYKNATLKQREDRRRRDRLYQATHEWTR